MAASGRSEPIATDQDDRLLYFALEPVNALTAGRQLMTLCGLSDSTRISEIQIDQYEARYKSKTLVSQIHESARR